MQDIKLGKMLQINGYLIVLEKETEVRTTLWKAASLCETFPKYARSLQGRNCYTVQLT